MWIKQKDCIVNLNNVKLIQKIDLTFGYDNKYLIEFDDIKWNFNNKSDRDSEWDEIVELLEDETY